MEVKDQIGVSVLGDPNTYVVELPVKLTDEESKELKNRLEVVMLLAATNAQERLRAQIRNLIGG